MTDKTGTEIDRQALLRELNGQTGKIPWAELQRQHAGGAVLCVGPGLDLVATAADVAQDNTDAIRPLLDEGQLAPVTDGQTEAWLEQGAVLWAVVVAPWVLVQETGNDS